MLVYYFYLSFIKENYIKPHKLFTYINLRKIYRKIFKRRIKKLLKNITTKGK
jgi:hypothetical protein